MRWNWFQKYDFSHVIMSSGLAYLAAAPQEVFSFGNITKPFPPLAWILIVLILFLLSSFFLVAHTIYLLLEGPLVVPESSVLNFYLFGFCKIAEPEPLPWFKRVAGGTVAVSTWSIFALFIVLFYQSNLRAYMVTVEYEKPLNTLQDVVDSGKKVWLTDSSIALQ